MHHDTSPDYGNQTDDGTEGEWRKVAVSKRLRYEVLRRDNFACRYCGATAPEAALVVDAVVPEALGGSHKDPANLVTSCESCNNGKSATPPDAAVVADVAQDALRWSRAMAAAAEVMLARDSEVTAAQERFAEVWDGWTHGDDKQPVPKDPGWRQSVNSLMAAGLPLAVLEECVQIAMRRRRVTPENTFRYMCGVAWRKVGELQRLARTIAVGTADSPGVPGVGGSYDEGRAAVAREVLAELIDPERDRYLDWADDGGWGAEHGDPQTEVDRLTSAACMAVSDIRCDLALLEQAVVDALGGLPGGTGKRAMKSARELLYDERGAEFSRHLFLTDALRHLLDELSFPDAAACLAELPEPERREWLDHVTAAHDGRISSAGWVVRAAKSVQMAASGRVLRIMCHGPGEHIYACTELGTYLAKIGELDCCGPGAPPDHLGHEFCERHLEQLVNGTFVARDGKSYTATDYSAMADSVQVPF